MKKKYNHIIPKVYQKRWHTAGTKANVFYYDLNLTLIDDKGGNVSKNLGEDYYYCLTERDIAYINERVIDITKHISDSKVLENYFDTNIENYWRKVLEFFGAIDTNFFSLKSKFLENKGLYSINCIVVSKDCIDKLVMPIKLQDFIITQWQRRFDNAILSIVETIIITVEISVMKGFIPKTEKQKAIDELLSDVEYVRSIWLACLIDNMQSSGTSLLEKFKEIKKNKFTTIAFFANESKFILSDNPVIYNISYNENKELPGGIYMPISPEILIAFLDCSNFKSTKGDIDPEDILLQRATNDFTQYINRCLLKQSIEKVGFFDKNIKNHIAEVYSHSGFNKMMNIPD